jgi:hypothetical protein
MGRKGYYFVAAVALTAAWTGCVSLKDDGSSVPDAETLTDGGAEAESGNVSAEGGIDSDALSSDADQSPRTIEPTNLKLWLAADQGVTCVSGRVTKWADGSPNHDDATLEHNQLGSECQLTQGAHVVHGVDLPYFSAPSTGNLVDETLDVDLTFLASNDYTIFAVERRWADYENGSLNDEMVLGTMVPPAYEGVIGANCPVANITLQLGYIYYNGATQLVLDQWCNGISSSVVRVTDGPSPLSQESAQFDRTRGHEVWVGGVPASDDPDTNALANADEGAVGSALTRATAVGVDPRFRGDIAELVVYDSALSSGERQAVEAYLKRRWGY